MEIDSKEITQDAELATYWPQPDPAPPRSPRFSSRHFSVHHTLAHLVDFHTHWLLQVLQRVPEFLLDLKKGAILARVKISTGPQRRL